ncbi:heme oxygenase-like multi-helical protein [Trifolium medium]|uniref:Heme oxygenase-like multi-helical protein n=1 Tax=Trifolium medium TaxID=97028 RepID=A0A392PGX0_9FABA|nr:heme oxygenase-like multi-helical protein [Trifolium medium]
MRWFLPNPIKTLPTFNNIRSISFRSFVRSSVRNRFQMAAIHNHSEAGLAKRFWIKFNRESIFAMYAPFVISLASGNLKIDSFRHYIAQDVHFLRAFAQA